MDDQPVSTQGSAATTVMLIWVLTGVILVTAAYLLIPSPGPWAALNAAGIVACIYLVALVLFLARKPLRFLARTALVIVALTVIGATGFTWLNAERYVDEQRKYFKERYIVDVRGMIFRSGSQCLLQTLRMNQETTSARSRSLEEMFRLRNPSATVGQPLPTADHPAFIKLYVEALKSDTIVLTGIGFTASGRNPEFFNVNGRKGLIQERFTLTREGMIHESQN